MVVCSEAEQLDRLRALPRHDRRGGSPPPRETDVARADVRAADRIIRTDGTLKETEDEVLRLWVALGLPLPTKPVED